MLSLGGTEICPGSVSNRAMFRVALPGGSRSSEPKRNGLKAPSDRRMENGVSSDFSCFQKIQILLKKKYFEKEQCDFIEVQHEVCQVFRCDRRDGVQRETVDKHRRELSVPLTALQRSNCMSHRPSSELALLCRCYFSN